MPVATTTTQDREFATSVLNISTMLDSSLEWIAANMSPQDVFDDDELREWARSNGFVEEI